MSKEERLENANKFIKTIASCGHKFFSTKEDASVAYFEIDKRGRIWFIDSRSKARIYLHYQYWGRGFSHGGTMRSLINLLFIYIKDGTKLPNVFEWPKDYCNGDLWAYGEDMKIVREKAKEFKIVA